MTLLFRLDAAKAESIGSRLTKIISVRFFGVEQIRLLLLGAFWWSDEPNMNVRRLNPTSFSVSPKLRICSIAWAIAAAFWFTIELSAQQPDQSSAGQTKLQTASALLAAGAVKIESVGTGETIGHVANLKIQNLTDQRINCVVPSMVLESVSRKNQDYVCPKAQTMKIEPHGTATVPINGVCINRNKPPVGKGALGDLIINTGDPTLPQNPDSHIPTNQAGDLLRICTAKYNAADQLQKSGALKNLPYRDPQKQKDIVVQWSTWCDPRISQITGAPPATKDDLRKVVYKQLESKKPMSPETKKKVDQGIDTIFEKVELTTAKAKDVEKPEPLPGGAVTTGKPGPFFKPATVAQPGDVVHVEDKPRGGNGHWAVKVKLPSGEIVEVWFESDEPPPLEFCNTIKINKTHTSSPGHNTVVDDYVKNPSPTPTATATSTSTTTATPKYKTYLWTPPPPATPTATPKYKIHLWTPPPTAAQPPQSPVPTEPEKPKEEGGKATEPEPWAPPDLPHWLEPWWEAVKAGTGIVPGKLPGGKDALGLIIQRLNRKISEEMANGREKEAEFYENLKKRLQDIYNSMEEKG